jgi:hypothetical protein
MNYRFWTGFIMGVFVVSIAVCILWSFAYGQGGPGPAQTYMSQKQIEALTTLCGKPAPLPNEPLPKKDHEDSFVPCMELRMLYREYCE